MTVETLFHVAAGGIGLAAGAAAMSFRKGSRLHRAAGDVFLVAMLAASASAAAIAWFVRPYMPGVVEGLLVFYLVATASATVMRAEGRVGAIDYAAPTLGAAVAFVCYSVGLAAAGSPDGLKDGIPASIYNFFAGLAGFSALLDASLVLRGGVRGRQRILRHLWRMSTAFLFAVTNFFVGNGAKVFAPEIRAFHVGPLPLLAVPSLVVLVLLLYWLIRVPFTNWFNRKTL